MKVNAARGTMKMAILLFALAGLAIPAGALAGSLEPSAAPAPTMRTLKELNPAWNRIIPAAQRFADALDGTAVLDKETGLVWAKAPDPSLRSWQAAMDYCTSLSLGGRKGWRLPSIEELGSLVDPNAAGTPKLPGGHPFQNVQTNVYWSSSSYAGNAGNAWNVSMDSGTVANGDKATAYHAWPVRSGQ